MVNVNVRFLTGYFDAILNFRSFEIATFGNKVFSYLVLFYACYKLFPLA